MSAAKYFYRILIAFMVVFSCLGHGSTAGAAGVEIVAEARVVSVKSADDQTREDLFKKVLTTIKHRFEAAGIKDYTIEPTEGWRFKVNLNGTRDDRLARDLITRTGRLRFQLVADLSPTRTKLRNPPAGTEVRFQMHRDPRTRRVARRPILLEKKAAIDGSHVLDARAEANQGGGYHVQLRLDAVGAKQLAEVTEKNIKRAMAIVLDGRVFSTPTIQAKIDTPLIRIAGNFNEKSARDLAAILRIGALPVPVLLLAVRYEDK